MLYEKTDLIKGHNENKLFNIIHLKYNMNVNKKLKMKYSVCFISFRDTSFHGFNTSANSAKINLGTLVTAITPFRIRQIRVSPSMCTISSQLHYLFA